LPLFKFLSSADLQIETDEQRAELSKALRDIAELPPEKLAEQRYADYQGNSGQWNILKILSAYYYSRDALLTTGDFMRELRETKRRTRFKKLSEKIAASIR
jgi:hypothetical protein